MVTNIFLGLPPPNVVKWIREEAERKHQEMLKTPLSFTATEDNSSVSLVCFDRMLDGFGDSWCKLDYSMDGKSWQAYIDPDSDDETLHRGKIISLSKGETVYFKATLGDVEGNPNLNGFRSNNGLKYHCFIMEGSIEADGNIQFLLENSGTKIDVPENCYYRIFSDCGNLTKAPALPATTLASGCYSSMFSSCISLTKAPALPATTLAEYCYSYMFSSCTSLVQAPALPAETLALYCYQHMFSDCTSLTQAPALPATDLDGYCYSGMFFGCTSLVQAPALPATSLDGYCYSIMFFGCTSLTKAPDLPATALVGYCYNSMFTYCTSLNSININFTSWDPSDATLDWVTSVSSSGTFTCPTGLPEEFGNDKIPHGWTVVRK